VSHGFMSYLNSLSRLTGGTSTHATVDDFYYLSGKVLDAVKIAGEPVLLEA